MAVDIQGERALPPVASRKRRFSWPALLSVASAVLALAALGAGARMYGESQREIVRLATEVAQLRISLDLYARGQETTSPIDPAALDDLGNRLAALEETARVVSAPAAPSLPELPPIAPPAGAPTAAANGDCLPTGTRFLVAAGDTYPVCGVAGTVEIGAVDNGFISLRDGTVIAAGGNIALAGTACMIGVVSAGENGMTGYAEIRVTC